MTGAVIRVLLVEDNPTDALVAQDELLYAVGVRFEVEVCTRLEPALQRLRSGGLDIVLLDLTLPDSEGLDTFAKLHRQAPDMPVVLLSHRADEAMAMQAVSDGAQDYLVKGQPEGTLVRAIRYALERARAEQALRRSEERWTFALEGTGDGVWDWDLALNTSFFSPRWKEMLGHTEAEVSNSATEWSSRVHVDDLSTTMNTLQAHLDGQTRAYSCEHRLRCKDGNYLWVLGRGMVVQRDTDGKALRVVGTNVDISERKAAENQLQLAASVFSHAREGIMITDAAGCILRVNDTFTQITGYSREEAVGQDPRILNAGRHEPEFFATMWSDLNTRGYWSGEIWNRRKNGEVFAELETISAIRDNNGAIRNYVALFTDITPMKDHQRQLEHVAHYDALTGLPNRVLLADRLQQAIAQAQRRGQCVAVAFLDLDGFKAVNDRYGHETGDALLNALAHRMKEALRDADTLSRFGGDEFVAVLVDLENAAACEPVLERLLQAVSEPLLLGDKTLQVSASIGVTLYPQDGGDADMLMRHADQAMYLAKVSGKNRYHLFDVAHDLATRSMREGLEQVRIALERKEFVLYYQPKVNMRTGVVIGAEALIRWQHPERGLLPPGLFLPIIEDHPMSIELGEWVIATALAQMTQWRALGLELPVSVNIGARQLQHGDFVERLKALLAQYPDVPPRTLELEILETSALEDITLVSDVMLSCQALGVRFALDDFGTGYSSLTYLKRLPAELLKIDQSFVRDMLTDTDDLAIVQGVIGLAKAFRRKVIAEGVETIVHGELLLPLGCELAQGYGIARPMPAAAIPEWVKTWKPDVTWSNPKTTAI